MMFFMETLRMRPGPASPGLGGSSFHSLGVLISKLKGLPYPAQNQSNRCRSIVIFEIMTSSIVPPTSICDVIPRLQLLMTQLLMTTLLIPTLTPSVNLMPAEAEENLQFVIVTSSHSRSDEKMAT